MNIIEKALITAKAAHAATGQFRKYTGEPYFNHVKNVARIIDLIGGDKEMIAAAYLHDIVEDTQIKHSFINENFTENIAIYVWELTDISRLSDGNRAIRKEIDRNHIKIASIEAKTIKLADLIDNSCSILKHDPNFAKVYLKEKRLLLDDALQDGDKALWKIANEIVSNGFIFSHEEIIKMIES